MKLYQVWDSDYIQAALLTQLITQHTRIVSRVERKYFIPKQRIRIYSIRKYSHFEMHKGTIQRYPWGSRWSIFQWYILSYYVISENYTQEIAIPVLELQ